MVSNLASSRSVVVTGCGGDLGISLVEKFVKNGDTVFACFRKFGSLEKEKLHKLDLLDSKAVIPLEADFNNITEITMLMRKIEDQSSKIDVLINNAAMAHGSALLMTTVHDLERCLRVNTTAPFIMSQRAGKNMIRNGGGVILFISSITSIEAWPGTTAYAMSKAALNQLCRVMALELGPNGVKVNAIAPGLIRTEMLKQNSERFVEKMLNQSAQARVAEAQEIAALAFFLASSEASHINGQIIKVDGGRH